MKVPSIITTGAVNLLSGLSNNKDSIIPMAFKDVISDCVTVATYKKEGGDDDPREKAIEEFGTGAFWLFGIPAIKFAIDKTLYPLLKLNPNLDLRLLKDKDRFQNVLESAREHAKENNSAAIKELNILESLKEKNSVLKSFTNEQLYKGLFVTKFATATIATGLILAKIIRYKQKTTKDRINNDIQNEQNSKKQQTSTLNKSVKNSQVYQMFTANDKKSNTPSFTGLGEFFMYNPIANTSLMDCVITGTRLKEARHGERKEVALKEGFQIAFVYLIARPLQLMFEGIGSKLNLPIGMDPKILFSKNVKEDVQSAYNIAKENGIYDLIENIKQVQKENKSSQTLLSKVKQIFKGAEKPAKEIQLENELIKKIYAIAKEDINNPLIKMLSENGTISIIKDKATSQSAVSFLQYIDEGELKGAMGNISDLTKNISNISGIKLYKALSVIANLAIGITATGAIEPLTAIWMRKKLNNGDNRNPAIVEQEKMMKAQAQSHQG